MKLKNQETIGELFVFGEATIYSLFPIVVSYTTKLMPPILFAALGTLAAVVPLLLWAIFSKKLKELRNKKALKYILGVTLFIVIIPSILIFMGSSKSTGINTGMLLQSEIPFTFIICALFFNEKITTKKIIGLITAILGTILIVYNGKPEINTWELLIIAATFFYPFGNIFAKKALKEVSTITILLARFTIGGSVLLAISLLFENYSQSLSSYAINFYPYILLSGIFIYCISKILLYEALKKMEISKVILLSTSSYPAISLLFAFLFLHEIPTIYQWSGFFVILIGILLMTVRKKSTEVSPQV